MAYDYKQVRAVPKSKPNRKKKKVEQYKGIKIPHRKKRSAMTKKDKQEAIEHHGEYCWECGNPLIEWHHAVFRSHLGRGGYRNLIPLCIRHHQKAHRSYEFAESLRHQLRMMYGIHHFKDKFDLWKEGLISSPEDDKFERFMQEQRNLLKAD